jgi:chromate transporter
MTSLSDIARVFGRIGVLSFGGPAAQIALMHRTLVEERAWLTERQFLQSLSFCMLLPGPEAMQLATYAGWRLRGTLGGMIAGGLFVLPGAAVICALALAYAAWGTGPALQDAFLGVKAAVIAIVVQALWRLSAKALKGPADRVLAASAFVALYALGLPFPLVIAAAALWGALGATARPAVSPTPAPAAGTWAQGLLWLVLWLLPLPLLALSGQALLFELAAFFATLAVVTFGGAYAVLAYMAQEVVQARGWLEATQMVDALGLAETTPGPLILVTQFVGMLAGHAQGGAGLAMIAGALTLWMTFVPCFLWIFAFAPHVEALLARPRLQGALSAITAAVVGVIANLSLWFALHVLFAETSTPGAGTRAPTLPVPETFRLDALVLTGLAVTLLVVLKRSVPLTLAAGATAGWALGQV